MTKLRKLRLLIVANTFWGRILSGGDYHMLRVVTEWEKHVDVTVLASKFFAISHACANDNLTPNKIIVKDPIPYSEKNNNYLHLAATIVRAVFLLFSRSKESYDVIVAPSHFIFDLFPCIFLKLRNKNSRLVVYVHSTAATTNNTARLLISTTNNLMGLFLVRLSADLVFVINNPVKERCIDFGIKNAKIVKTSNAVDIVSSVGYVDGGADAKTFAACFLGRFGKEKGVYDLLSVWKLICSKLPSAKLAIIGDGPGKGQMEKISIKLGLEQNLTFFGFISGDEKYRILKNSAVFIYPSHAESWGISVAEAMACGLSVVAYNLPTYKEVFEDKIIMVPIGDIDSMAKQVVLLLENPEFSREIGQKGREFVKKYDWSIVAERELTVIVSLKGKTWT